MILRVLTIFIVLLSHANAQTDICEFSVIEDGALASLDRDFSMSCDDDSDCSCWTELNKKLGIKSQKAKKRILEKGVTKAVALLQRNISYLAKEFASIEASFGSSNSMNVEVARSCSISRLDDVFSQCSEAQNKQINKAFKELGFGNNLEDFKSKVQAEFVLGLSPSYPDNQLKAAGFFERDFENSCLLEKETSLITRQADEKDQLELFIALSEGKSKLLKALENNPDISINSLMKKGGRTLYRAFSRVEKNEIWLSHILSNPQKLSEFMAQLPPVDKMKNYNRHAAIEWFAKNMSAQEAIRKQCEKMFSSFKNLACRNDGIAPWGGEGSSFSVSPEAADDVLMGLEENVYICEIGEEKRVSIKEAFKGLAQGVPGAENSAPMITGHLQDNAALCPAIATKTQNGWELRDLDGVLKEQKCSPYSSGEESEFCLSPTFASYRNLIDQGLLVAPRISVVEASLAEGKMDNTKSGEVEDKVSSNQLSDFALTYLGDLGDKDLKLFAKKQGMIAEKQEEKPVAVENKVASKKSSDISSSENDFVIGQQAASWSQTAKNSTSNYRPVSSSRSEAGIEKEVTRDLVDQLFSRMKDNKKGRQQQGEVASVNDASSNTKPAKIAYKKDSARSQSGFSSNWGNGTTNNTAFDNTDDRKTDSSSKNQLSDVNQNNGTLGGVGAASRDDKFVKNSSRDLTATKGMYKSGILGGAAATLSHTGSGIEVYNRKEQDGHSLDEFTEIVVLDWDKISAADLAQIKKILSDKEQKVVVTRNEEGEKVQVVLQYEGEKLQMRPLQNSAHSQEFLEKLKDLIKTRLS